MNQEKLNQVLSDQAFVESLLEMETPEQVQTAMKAKDIDLAIDDIVKVREVLIAKKDSSDELTSEDLDNVAGGIAITMIVSAIAGAIAGAATAGGFVHRITRGRW